MAEPALSAREREVLTLVAQGLSTADIAARLHISAHTVASHVRRVRRVLGASSRQRAVVVARERGLLLGGGDEFDLLALVGLDVRQVGYLPPSLTRTMVQIRPPGSNAPGKQFADYPFAKALHEIGLAP